MAKKKVSKTKQSPEPTETIHFRPGAELGAAVSELADQLTISRGEACKRLVGLSIRGLDVGFYAYAEELTQYLYGTPTFDEACHHLHVAIQEAPERATHDADIVEVDRAIKLEAVRRLLERYRTLRTSEELAEKSRVYVRVYCTD